MNREYNFDKNVSALVVFAVSFALTLSALKLTMLNSLGPGISAAWAATSVGMGQSLDAVWSPLFTVFVKTVGAIGPITTAASRVNFLTAFGIALTAGFASLIFSITFRRWKIWGANFLAGVGGTVVGISKVIWISGLAPNPSTWALTSIAFSWWMIVSSLDDEDGTGFKRQILAAFGTGLAIAFYLPSIIILPANLWLIFKAAKKDNHNFMPVFLFLLLPLSAYIANILFAGNMQSVYSVKGIFTAAQGIPENIKGLSLIGWSALYTLTPVGLLLAIWGVISLHIRNKSALVVIVLTVVGIIVGAFCDIVYPFATVLTALVVSLFTIIGIIDLFDRIPKGFSILLVLLIPVLWAYHGPDVNRGHESIWEDHISNQTKSSPYKSIILSPDDVLLNPGYAYLLKSNKWRVDLTVLNPLEFDDISYLNWVDNLYGSAFDSTRSQFENLKSVVARGNASDSELAAKEYIKTFVNQKVDVLNIRESKDYRPQTKIEEVGNILCIPGYDPGTEQKQIAIGLYFCIWPENENYNLFFRSFKMKKIKFHPRATNIEMRLIALYPYMFTIRGSWMLENQITAGGIDYIRWALRIDPNFMPATLIAQHYNISGDPLKLFPKDWRK
jgi:Protein O-mannosyl-transferase TMEM260-like